MKNFLRIVLTLPLLASSVAAQSPRSPGPDLARFDGAVHSNWHAAVVASGIDLRQPIQLTPVAVHRGAALYELVGLHTGETALAYASVPRILAAPAGQGGDGELDRAVEAACSTPGYVRCNDPYGTDFTLPDASRCTVTFYRDVNFTGTPMSTNVDWNTLSDLSGGGDAYNDTLTSVITTCAPVYVFKNANWAGSVLYIPANTSIGNLGVYGFNDVISSMWHVLP